MAFGAETHPEGCLVGDSKSGTTIGPATPLPPLWMCPITIVPTRLTWIVKQTRPLPGRSTMRAEPLPPSAFGTSL